MQQINLYDSIREQKKFIFKPEYAAWIFGIFVAWLLISLLMQLWHTHTLGNKYAEAKKKFSLKENELLALVKQYPSIDPKDLKKSVQKLEEQLIVNEEIVDLLGDQPNFSDYLRAIARATYPGVWLTQINIFNQSDQIVLEGYAMQAGGVQQFLAQIMRQPIFSHMSFTIQELKEITTKEGSLINFQLANKGTKSS